MSRAIQGRETGREHEVGAAIFTAARELVGTRFRLHGRDVATGVDCVGLVALAYARAGIIIFPVPDDYALRGMKRAEMEAGLVAAGLTRRAEGCAGGDVALVACGHGQLHLAIMGEASHVHAHAGLRCVVETPGIPDGMIAVFHRNIKS